METKDYYYIRKMKDADIPQVLDIDLDAFPTQWPHPTTSSYHHELRNKLAHYIVLYRTRNGAPDNHNNHHIGFKEVVAYIKGLFNHDRFFGPENPSSSERLIGMAGIWMMVGEAHIVTIAVRGAYKTMGLGERLLIALIDMARQLNAKTITLEVRVSNTVAQTLYKKYGFLTAGTRRKYYSDNGEDALIMTTDDVTAQAYEDMFQRLKQEHRKRWNMYYAE